MDIFIQINSLSSQKNAEDYFETISKVITKEKPSNLCIFLYSEAVRLCGEKEWSTFKKDSINLYVCSKSLKEYKTKKVIFEEVGLGLITEKIIEANKIILLGSL
tara:strand:- start:16674 stop:16985 length:312 start_codon:yes stop_codon:yes gene_type:complete